MSDKLVQIVKYKCCDKTFAACYEPECYTDKEWTKSLRKYVLQGHKVSVVKYTDINFQKCTCNDIPPSTDLFTETEK